MSVWCVDGAQVRVSKQHSTYRQPDRQPAVEPESQWFGYYQCAKEGGAGGRCTTSTGCRFVVCGVVWWVTDRRKERWSMKFGGPE